MKRITFFFIILSLFFCSCSKIVTSYSIRTIKYPNFIATDSSWFIGEERISEYEYDERNFFIWSTQIAGCNFSTLELLIDPRISFKELNIIEISFIKDDEKIILIENKKIKYSENIFTHLMNIKFRNYPKIFKNMEIGDREIIKIIQKYQFDNCQITIEESDYTLICFEYEHNPIMKYAFWY